jgi:hypothetical protein
VATYFRDTDLRRLDTREDTVEVTYFIPMSDAELISGLLRDLRRKFPAIGVSYLDQSQLSAM